MSNIYIDTIYLETERELAKLQGWTGVTIRYEFMSLKAPAILVGTLPNSDSDARVPAWCRDWAACGQLMVDYAAYPEEVLRNGHIPSIIVIDRTDKNFPTLAWEDISNHPNKEAAVRYAIAQAVIAKLKANLAKAVAIQEGAS